MSSKLDDRIDELEDLITNRFHEIGKRSGVPFIIFPYPPSSGLRMEKKIDSFVDRLEFEDKDVVTINMREVFFSILKERGLIDSVIEMEKERKEELSDALRPVFFEGVGDDLGDLPKSVLEKKDEGDLIVLHQLGILYPFSSLSSILTELENKVEKPVVAFYPAEKDGQELEFLGETDGSYYRAKVI